MKKTILALLVLLTAALVFTGCPKETAAPNLDGTWIGYAETDMDGMLETPVTIAGMKMEIAGNTVKGYDPDETYQTALFVWALAGATGNAPDASWEESATGSVVISGKTLTFNFGGDDVVGTLANDNKSFDITDEDGTVTFKKQ